MRKEQATKEMKLNQFEAGSMQPSRKRRYVEISEWGVQLSRVFNSHEVNSHQIKGNMCREIQD